MEINFYRDANSQGYDESWQACQFTSDTDLSSFSSNPLVTINGLAYLRQHHVTYLTGKETCRAHHFAKHLAIQVLTAPATSCPVGGGSAAVAPSSLSTPPSCKVLWIDTLNGPHVAAAIYRELSHHATDDGDLHYTCLDVLGGQRDDHWWLNRSIEKLINDLKPQLVVIDDIDHFMPYCGVRVATLFDRTVRDVVNHCDTAFLLIGYNHTGKKACTAGELGRRLFTSVNDIFALSTVRDVTTVRHISGYDLHVFPGDSQFHFSIGNDNLPHETGQPRMAPASGIDDDTLRDIVDGIIQPGQDITTADLLAQVKARHTQLKRHTRDAALLDQIQRLHLLTPYPQEEAPSPNESAPSVRPVDPAPTVPLAVPRADAERRPQQDQKINTLLTLPTHPQPALSPNQSAPSVRPVDSAPTVPLAVPREGVS